MTDTVSVITTEELTTKPELWSWWTYNFAFEPISIVHASTFILYAYDSFLFILGQFPTVHSSNLGGDALYGRASPRLPTSPVCGAKALCDLLPWLSRYFELQLCLLYYCLISSVPSLDVCECWSHG